MSRTTLQSLGAGSFKLVLATVFVVLVGHVNPFPNQWGSHSVHPGQSIQAAIDSAHHGGRIYVKPGTYAEQLTITTDGIALIGYGAVLVPPAAPCVNTCSGLA